MATYQFVPGINSAHTKPLPPGKIKLFVHGLEHVGYMHKTTKEMHRIGIQSWTELENNPDYVKMFVYQDELQTKTPEPK